MRNFAHTITHYLLSGLVVFGFSTEILAQNNYGFSTTIDLEETPVISQGNTGTCWSYSTTSFIESELIRKGKGRHDLSEMFNARMIYEDKADNYVRRQGKAQFSQGSLGHDVLRVIAKHGVMPNEHYNGLLNDAQVHNHDELERVLSGVVSAILNNDGKPLSPHWKSAFSAILDSYLGKLPERFTYQGKEYTPATLTKELGIEPADYVSISSFSHHPFYQSFILEVPDNYSNGSFWNIPLDEFVKITRYALENGFTLAWDADVSEKGFSRQGIAILPEIPWSEMLNEEREAAFDSPVKELEVTQKNRQEAFDNQQTTDDHLMHITGMATDSKGNTYFVVKNSWGTNAGIEGYVYVSEAYFRMKSISIIVHKDGVPKDTRKKFGL